MFEKPLKNAKIYDNLYEANICKISVDFIMIYLYVLFDLEVSF